MLSILSDARYGVRLLFRSPGFAIAAIVTLALGIGFSTAIFGVVNAVLLRPLPFSEPGRIIRIWESNLQEGNEKNPVSPPNFIDWRRNNQVFGDMAAYSSWSPNAVGPGSPERLRGLQVSANMFALLGVDPLVGRYFRSGDERSEDGNVVVISHDLWQRWFAASPEVTKQVMILNGNRYSIVGVMPADFDFPPGAAEKRELWIPLAFETQELRGRSTRYLQVLARLKPGVSLDQARDRMQRIATWIEERHPESNRGWSVTLMPLHEQLVAGTKPTLLALLAAVGFVLLIGCVNVANLVLARAAGRYREMAVRVAVGARRGRIFYQLLTEYLILAIIGGGLGAVLAKVANQVIVATSPDSIPRLKEVTLDAPVLVFGATLSLLTALVFGVFPALRASRPNVRGILNEGGKGVVGGKGRNRFRGILVAAEVALALVLLVGSGLMLKSFQQLISVDSGFDPEGVLTAEITLPSYRYEGPEQQRMFFDQLVAEIQSLPAVQSAGVISYLPLSGSNMEWIFRIEGRVPSTPDGKLFAEYRQVSARYFEAMGITLLRGRGFSEADVQGAAPVIVINDAFARQYFQNENPLRKRIGFGLEPEWREVVGVVADVRHFGLETEAKAEAYVPYQQDPWPAMALVVRSKTDPVALASAIRSQIDEIDKSQPFYNVKTMETLVAESVASRRLAMLLLSTFAVVALVLAAVGVFGVMADSVRQRTHEIAVRMALGARPRMVQRLIVFQAVALALAGIAIGILVSSLLTRFIANLLYGVSTNDPVVICVVASALMLVLLLASYIPARRATEVDPVSLLR